MKRSVFAVALIWLFAAASCGPDEPTHLATPLTLDYPDHFVEPTIPSDNEMTVEGVKLGRHLFFDERLSGNNTQSCGSCHLQESNFAEYTRFSTGIDGIEGTMNAMTLTNLAWQEFFFWNGRASSLEEQVLEPVENPIEMHETWTNVIAKLEQDPEYVGMFEDAFGPEALTKENAAKAMAQFIRTLVSGNSPFDQYLQGTYTLSESEALGMEIFNNERGDCFHCHGLASTGYQMGAFGLLQFTNNGLDSTYEVGEGREAVTGNPSDRGRFKIPSLRNVEYSFPYMHDGRFATLGEVIDFYDMGGHPSPTIDPNMKAAGVGRNWSDVEKQALIDFLKTFSDADFLTDTSFTNPW
jgi:cytochrome c peroxidase